MSLWGTGSNSTKGYGCPFPRIPTNSRPSINVLTKEAKGVKMVTFAEQILQVKEIVQKKWHKGSYFSVRGDDICCCVHGAVQIVCNPMVREVIENYTRTDRPPTPAEKAARADAAVVVAAGEAPARAWSRAADGLARAGTSRAERDKILRKVWQDRESWICQPGPRGSLELHYLLGMFGIWLSFNDAHTTTLDMLLGRLDECMEWARENEEFLRSN